MTMYDKQSGPVGAWWLPRYDDRRRQDKSDAAIIQMAAQLFPDFEVAQIEGATWGLSPRKFAFKRFP
jgi:hypothetical protein